MHLAVSDLSDVEIGKCGRRIVLHASFMKHDPDTGHHKAGGRLGLLGYEPTAVLSKSGRTDEYSPHKTAFHILRSNKEA